MSKFASRASAGATSIIRPKKMSFSQMSQALPFFNSHDYVSFNLTCIVSLVLG